MLLLYDDKIYGRGTVLKVHLGLVILIVLYVLFTKFLTHISIAVLSGVQIHVHGSSSRAQVHSR